MDLTLSTVTIENLPHEVLVEIMSKLSMTNRRNCRLTCKKWHGACSVFERKERICIGRMYEKSVDEIMSSLLESTRSCFHFEFYGLCLEDDNETRKMFWKTCGPRISSLKLCYGKLKTSAFINILRYCSNLHTLEFYFHSIIEMRDGGLSVACLKDCVDLKLQNKSLKTLKIYFGDRPASFAHTSTIEDEWSLNYLTSLCHLFSLFPNISNFVSHKRNWISYSDRFRGNPRHVEGGNAEELMDLLHEYLSRDQMESITISWLWLSLRDWTTFIKVLCSRTTKMTEMIFLDSERSTAESFLRLVSRQTNLQTITYIFSNPGHTSKDHVYLANQFISQLRHVPTVRRLCLVSRRSYSSAVAETSRTTTDLSRRRVAEEQCAWTRQSHVLKEPFPLIEKVTATTLEPNAMPILDFVLLLNDLPNLKDVQMSSLDRNIMTTINTKHPKLESLVVQSSAIDRDVASVFPIFINSLKELRYLEVPETLKFLPQCFNRLKFVHIVRHVKPRLLVMPGWPTNTVLPYSFVSTTPLLQILGSYQLACPSLEIACFDLECSIVTQDQIEGRPFSTGKNWIMDAVANFVAELENLKYFYFNCDTRSFRAGIEPTFTATDVSHIFERSRSLRVLKLFRQFFFKHAIEDRVCEMMYDYSRHSAERCSVMFEFLEMFYKEDKEPWFEDTYFHWLQSR